MRSDVLDGSKNQSRRPDRWDRFIGYSLEWSLIGALLAAKTMKPYWKALLTPTKIYTREVEALQASQSPIYGLAHITGGGLLNIARLNTSVITLLMPFQF